MLKKSTIGWTAKALVGKINRGEVVFDNAVQRNLCWDADRKSLFIHSMIEEFPVPHFFAAKNEEKGYDMLDGKQRSNTILAFVNNGFALSHVTPETALENGEVYELIGKRFNDLPEELQDRVNDFLLNIYYFDDITDDEIVDMFFRLNNGKSMSAIELTRVRAISMEQIHEAAKHEIFKLALTSQMLAKYTNEELIIKSFAVLNVENPSFTAKDIRSLMEEVEITDEHILELYDIYDRFIEIYNDIKESGNKLSTKARAAIAKNILKRTHFISLIPVVKQSIADNITIDAFAEWVQLFFNGDKATSVSTEYNETTTARTTNRENIQKRHNAMMNHYNNHFKTLANQAV